MASGGIQAEVIPHAVWASQHEADVNLRYGGEDYELLFTARPNKRVPSRIAGVPITLIGHIMRGQKIFLMNRFGVGYKLELRGWEHFRS